MNAYNPLSSTKRLEAAGMPRAQAEAIAFEITESTDDLVTNEKLDSALESAINKGVIKIGIMTSAIVALACSVMGVLLSLK
jgi:hypothetical protein